jgi:hypothetical protein
VHDWQCRTDFSCLVEIPTLDEAPKFDEQALMDARSKHELWLQGRAGFAGSGIGVGRDGNPCIKIYTNGMTEATKQSVSAVLSRVPFEFEETGEFRAF